MLIQSNIVTKAPSSVDTSVTGNAVGAFLSTPQPNFGKVEVTLSATTQNTFADALPTTSIPSSSGQTSLLFSPSIEDPTLLRIMPYAGASNLGSPRLRVIGWNSYVQSASTLYVPMLLADLDLAYSSNVPSVAIDGNTRHFFHNISATAAPPVAPTSVPVLYAPGTSAAAGTPPAQVVIDTMGTQFVTVQFRSTTASAVMGALWCCL